MLLLNSNRVVSDPNPLYWMFKFTSDLFLNIGRKEKLARSMVTSWKMNRFFVKSVKTVVNKFNACGCFQHKAKFNWHRKL